MLRKVNTHIIEKKSGQFGQLELRFLFFFTNSDHLAGPESWGRGMWGGGRPPNSLPKQPSLPTPNTKVLGHQATENVANSKNDKMAKIYKI